MLRIGLRRSLLSVCVLAVVMIAFGLMQVNLLDRKPLKPLLQRRDPPVSIQELLHPRQPRKPDPLRVDPGRDGQARGHKGSEDAQRKGSGEAQGCLTSGRPSQEKLGRLLGSGRKPDWLSPRDQETIMWLREGSVRKVDRLYPRRKMARVVLELDTSQLVEDNRDYCGQGSCALVRETGNLDAMLRFHLDRLLGLEVVPPTTARVLSTWLLPFHYTDGRPHALSWSNPFPGWDCEGGPPCEGGEGGSAQRLLDYLLQGPDGGVMTSDRQDELVTGMTEQFEQLPQRARSVLASGCVSDGLLLSLHTDRTYWESRSETSLLELVRLIQGRAASLTGQLRDRAVTSWSPLE
ncbi:F198A protein, partial [Amia calva]|nr:F198A protein [Amia calva]